MANPPPLQFVGWVGFLPKKGYKEGEMWTYETTTEYFGLDDDGKQIFRITMHLDKPLKQL